LKRFGTSLHSPKNSGCIHQTISMHHVSLKASPLC
jgi:hypothetical protein